jgi:type IV pilus assembly protein PilB
MPRPSFERFLLETRVFDDGQLAHALSDATVNTMSLWTYVSESRGIAPATLTDDYAAWLRAPRLRLASTPPAADAVALVPEKLARRHNCVPISVDENRLVVAFLDPADVAAIRDVEFAASRTVRAVVSSPEEIADALEQAYAPAERLNDLIASVPEPEFIIEGQAAELGGETHVVDEAPIVRLCRNVLFEAIARKASDVHIEPALHDLNIRLRIDGVLRDHLRVPKWLHAGLVSRFKIIGGLDIAEKRLPQDGRFDVRAGERRYDIRLSTLPTHFGEKVVLRVLGASGLGQVAHLGLTDDQRTALERALSQPQGTIVVTGPTGAGKTTTLYALLAARLSTGLNLVTVEDPIEQRLEGVNQVQVNTKAGLSFAATLRAILRQDPDVILVGEIRDKDTAEVAFQAAITGHLVMTTLHTTGTVQTITRLRDMGLDAFLIGSSLSLIIAQRLARRLCVACRQPILASRDVAERLGVRSGSVTIYRAAGCGACDGTGYLGRVSVYEVLPVGVGLREKIQAGASDAELRRAGVAAGTQWLWDNAARKVLDGVTSYEEVTRVVQMDESQQAACPGCRASIDPDFSTCPYCLRSLKQTCATCGQDLRADWLACPYCRAAASVQTAAPAAPAAPAAIAARPAAPGALPTRRIRVLVVDDDPELLLITADALKALPFETVVSTAADGFGALEMIERDVPDVVVLDLSMPGIDGFEVCRRLRAGLRTAFVPVIMLTANASENARTTGFLVGTDDYVAKPYAVPELQARVTRLIRRTYGV